MREGWREATLGDIVVADDGTPVADPSDHELATVRLHAAGIAPTGRRPNRTAGGRKHFQRRAGQILVGRQNFDRRCVGVVPDSLDGYVTSNAISAFRARDGVESVFAFLAMSAPSTAAAADERMSGTGQREISQRALLRLPVLIPPVADQRRIVDLIGTIDDAIEKAEAKLRGVQQLAERLRQALPDAPTAPLRDVLVAIESGVSTRPKDGTGPAQKMLTLAAIRPARFRASEVKPVGSADLPERTRVAEGDLLITRSNTPERVGYVAIAREVQTDTYLPDLVWRLRPNTEKVSPSYLEHALSSPRMRALVTGSASGTSQSMRKINKTNFGQLEVPVPSLEAQRAYVEPLDALAVEERGTEGVVDSLRALRIKMLAVLLSGEHEIPQTYDELMEVAA